MSTHYDRLPPLEERVRASSLIVIGVVQSIKPMPKSRIGEIEEQQAIAQLTVDKTLRGPASLRQINVRFVSSRADAKLVDSDTFKVGQRLVLLAVPDVGPDASPNVFVAYLGSAFPLNANEVFMVESDSESSGPVRTRVTIEALRGVVKAILTEEAADKRSWAKFEPQLSKRPMLSAVTEIPEPLPGAGPTSTEPTGPAATRISEQKPSK